MTVKSSLLALCAIAAFAGAASAYGDPPAGYRVVGCDSGQCRLEKIPADREIGARFSSPTYESGDPFKAESKTLSSPECPDGRCALRAKQDVPAPKGAEIAGCKDGTCAKPSSFAKAPPSPGDSGEAKANAGSAAAKGGCGGGAKAGGGAAKGGGCKNGKGGPFAFIANFFQAIGRALGLA